MQLDEYHVLMPRARRHPVITKWTAAKLHATYSGDALITHLAAHAYRLLCLSDGGGRGYEDHSIQISPFEKEPFHDMVREHQAHFPPTLDEECRPSTSFRQWGVEPALRLWNMGLESACVEHLVESKQRIQWIVEELWDVTQYILDVIGPSAQMQASYFEKLDDIPSEPPTAERPLHIHVSEHPAGGGNTDLFYERLTMCSIWLERGGGGCPGWWITSCEDNPWMAGFSNRGGHINTWNLTRLAQRPVENSGCLASVIFAAYCLEHFVIPEINTMLHELNGWRKCVAGIAMHERVGKGSVLHAIGPDIMRMVFKWM